MPQEAKQNARSNEFVLSSERAEFKAQSCCAVYRHLRENGAHCAIYRHERERGGGGGEGERNIFFHERLLMSLVIYVLIDVKFNGKR